MHFRTALPSTNAAAQKIHLALRINPAIITDQRLMQLHRTLPPKLPNVSRVTPRISTADLTFTPARARRRIGRGRRAGRLQRQRIAVRSGIFVRYLMRIKRGLISCTRSCTRQQLRQTGCLMSGRPGTRLPTCARNLHRIDCWSLCFCEDSRRTALVTNLRGGAVSRTPAPLSLLRSPARSPAQWRPHGGPHPSRGRLLFRNIAPLPSLSP